MDREYKKLKGNPGLKYAVFTKYRNTSRSETGWLIAGCRGTGEYPENKRLQNLLKQRKKLDDNVWKRPEGRENEKKAKALDKQIKIERERSKKLSIK